MLKPIAWIALLALWSASFQQGCEDAKKSLTKWTYYPIRDMRQTVATLPQRDAWSPNGPVRWGQVPDSLSVPTIGRDPYLADIANYEAIGQKLVAPPSTDASVARGDSLFNTVCWTCHGKTLIGDGPVSAKFVPPPDLLAEMTRLRTDGYMYMYMRHGGAIMPSYGNVLSSRDAWDIIHYVRYMQKVSPR
jgi:mono/diheme cytochrome c family protein